MLKIIIIIIGYTLNDFITSCDNIIIGNGKFNNLNFKKNELIFCEKIIICFVNVETDPRLRYLDDTVM
jgi:hypothetical protein